MENKTTNRKYAVIDVGSNTIRTVIYAVDKEKNSVRELISEREFTGIIAYVKYGILCEAGQLQLIEVLKKMKEFCELADCRNIACFSTASLRYAENLSEVVERVRVETGIEIRPLLEEEELFYDLEGLRSADVEKEGTGLDLGGGSCQIFRYDESGFRASISLKIGCLTLSNACVGGIFPTKAETKKNREKVKRAIKDLREEMRVPEGGYIYAMGGTARAAARVHCVLSAAGTVLPSGNIRISRDALEDIVDLARCDVKGCIRLLSRVAPARMHTLIAGVIVLRTICKALGAEGIEVVRTGIREGYLHKAILEKEKDVPAGA